MYICYKYKLFDRRNFSKYKKIIICKEIFLKSVMCIFRSVGSVQHFSHQISSSSLLSELTIIIYMNIIQINLYVQITN